jgi:hypothetical protein
MEAIEPTGYIISETVVLAFLGAAMTVNLPFMGNLDDFALKTLTADGISYPKLHKFFVYFSWAVRFTVLSICWATFTFGVQYANAALDQALPNSDDYENLNYVKYQMAWFTSIATVILLYKFMSDMFYQYVQKETMMNAMVEERDKTKKALAKAQAAVDKAGQNGGNASAELAKLQSLESRLYYLTHSYPFYGHTSGGTNHAFQAIIFILFLFPIGTDVAYEWGMFRNPAGVNATTMTSPDPDYRIMVTIFTAFTMFGILLYVLMQLMAMGSSFLFKGKDATVGGINVANIFDLANLDFSRLSQNSFVSLLAWRGSKHDAGAQVDGVEHNMILGVADGSVMLASLGHWVLFLYVVIFDYTAYLVLKNNERWIGFVIITNLVPLFFSRVSREGSKVFFEYYIWCMMGFWLNYMAFYGWNYHLGTDGWDPANGLQCPSGSERFCFFSIPGYRNMLSYAEMTPILIGLGFFMVVLVVMQIVQILIYFMHSGVYDSTDYKFKQKILEVNTQVNAKVKPA